MTNLYNVLKVPQNASKREIKQSFRKLALKLHPDAGGCVKQFRQANEAYQVLSDVQKRKAYDLSIGRHQPHFGHSRNHGHHHSHRRADHSHVIYQPAAKFNKSHFKYGFDKDAWERAEGLGKYAPQAPEHMGKYTGATDTFRLGLHRKPNMSKMSKVQAYYRRNTPTD